MNKLIVVIGPTGVGKTAHAIELAKKYDCPIISADSRQIYYDLPIGTAAPTEEEQLQAKHYLVGFKALQENYNAGQFARDANLLLDQLFQLHNTVVVVGGSMMYIDALCKGLDDIPEVPTNIRLKVQQAYKEHGLEWLQKQVQELDPAYWQEVDKKNPQRLMHCLEICYATQKPFSYFRKKRLNQKQTQTNREIEYVLIEKPREELYQRINNRVDKMIQDGLLQEAKRAFDILNIPLDAQTPWENLQLPNSINTVGYKELLRYFRGEWTLEKAVEMIKQNSRHYAKRQMTWWRAKERK